MTSMPALAPYTVVSSRYKSPRNLRHLDGGGAGTMKYLRDRDQCRVDFDIWTPVRCRRGRMAGGEYIASHTITYEYTYYRRSTSWSPPFNFPMEQREFTRVIFLSSLARVSK